MKQTRLLNVRIEQYAPSRRQARRQAQEAFIVQGLVVVVFVMIWWAAK